MDYFNFMGFGTILYGTRERDPNDSSYVTTGWVILFYLPIIPLRSYRVIVGNQGGSIISVKVEYLSVKVIELNKRQVINTYILWYLPILFVVLFFWWLASIPA